MKAIIPTILFVLASFFSFAQCSSMGMSIASSGSDYALMDQIVLV